MIFLRSFIYTLICVILASKIHWRNLSHSSQLTLMSRDLSNSVRILSCVFYVNRIFFSKSVLIRCFMLSFFFTFNGFIFNPVKTHLLSRCLKLSKYKTKHWIADLIIPSTYFLHTTGNHHHLKNILLLFSLFIRTTIFLYKLGVNLKII